MKTFLYIVSVLGLILWSVAFFFGFNYMMGGSLMVSIPVAVCLLAVMGGALYVMIRKSQDKDRTARNTERAAIAVYVILSLASCIFVGHFVDVTDTKQDAIREEAMNQINELETVYAESAVAGSYEEWVNDVKSTYARSLYGEDEGTINTRVAELETALLTHSGFVQTRNKVLDFVGIAKGDIENWNWFWVADQLNGLRANREDWIDDAKADSRKSDYTRDTLNFYEFSPKFTNSEIFDGISTLDFGGCFGWLSLLLIVVLQFMMVFVYFAARPDRGSGPRRYKGPNVGTYVSPDDSNSRRWGNSAPTDNNPGHFDEPNLG